MREDIWDVYIRILESKKGLEFALFLFDCIKECKALEIARKFAEESKN